MIKKSTVNFWKMQGEGAWGIQRVLNMIHGYFYYTMYDYYIACGLTVVRLLNKVSKFAFKVIAIDFFSNRYHCKVITHENARKLISLEEDVVLPTEESKKIIPWEIANKIILKYMDYLAVVDCPCRLEKKLSGKKYCEPLNTCIFFGKTGVEFVTTHMPRMNGHRASKEDVLKLIDIHQKNGKVLTVWFKDGTGYRAGVLCCCCSCCCGSMEIGSLARKNGIKGITMTAPSGYSIAINTDSCQACGKCVKSCHYDALTMEGTGDGKKLVYLKDWCMGCGVCVSACPNETLSLVADPEKGKIFDVDALLESAHQRTGSLLTA
jgi:NAD-dependent dihydropyrimidine dehydrogenase PreA subunit